MEEEKEEEQNLVSKMSLNRKFTCVLQDEEEYDLSALNLCKDEIIQIGTAPPATKRGKCRI